MSLTYHADVSATSAMTSRRRLRRSLPGVIAALLVLCLCGWSLAIAAKTGAGDIPQSDAWSYIKSALILHDQGTLKLQGFGQMFLLGQLYTAQPFLWLFGAKVFSLDLYGAFAMAAFLGCVFAVGCRCVGKWLAVILVGVLGIWPGMPLLTASFMTDAPAAAASWLSLLLGIVAIERRSRVWLAGSLLAGFFAFTIREQLAFSMVAVALAALLTRNVSKRFRWESCIAVVLVLGVCAVLEHVRRHLPNADVAPFNIGTLNLRVMPPTLPRLLFTTALVVAPLALWTLFSLRGRDWIQPGRVAGWVTCLLIAGYLSGWHFDSVPRLINGNYIQPWGAFGGNVTGRVPDMMTTRVWYALQFIALGSAIVLAGEIGAHIARPARIVEALRGPDAAKCVVTVYGFISVAFAMGLSFAGQEQYDRYMLAFYPCVGMLLLRRVRRPHTAPEWSAVGVLGLVAACLGAFMVLIGATNTISTDVRDALAWRAATRLVARGIPATAINAGLDWNGAHATTAIDRVVGDAKPITYPGQHWTNLFPESENCYVVTFSTTPSPNWTLLHVSRTKHYGLPMKTLPVYTYRRAWCS